VPWATIVASVLVIGIPGAVLDDPLGSANITLVGGALDVAVGFPSSVETPVSCGLFAGCFCIIFVYVFFCFFLPDVSEFDEFTYS
jgi:hypothetical protein